SARACARGKAWRAAGRRLSGRIAGNVAVRAVRETLDDALSQSAGDGDRRAFTQPSDRWRRPAGWLRQDHAWPDHGRNQHGTSGNLRARWPAIAWKLARAATRLRVRRLEILGREARWPYQRGRLGRTRRRHLAQLRHLHGYGNGRDHDGNR